MRRRKVLVTGASGFVGRHLVPALLESGASVRALVRPTSRKEALQHERVALVEGDLTDEASLRRAARGCDAAIHLAAATDVSDPAVNRRLNVDGARDIVAACVAERVGRLLFFSTHCARREKRDAYGDTKLEGERYVRESPLEWTLFRPTMICGRGSKEFETFVAIVRRLPVVPVIGPGTYRLRPSCIEDVVPAVLRCLERDSTAGKTYEIAGAEPITMRELIALVARLMDKRRPVVSVPAALVLPAVRALGALMTHTPLSVDQVMAFLQHTEADIEPARRDLDFDPRPLEEGLAWLRPVPPSSP